MKTKPIVLVQVSFSSSIELGVGHPYRLFYEEYEWDPFFTCNEWQKKCVTLHFCGDHEEASREAEKYCAKNFRKEPHRFRNVKIRKIKLEEVEWTPAT